MPGKRNRQSNAPITCKRVVGAVVVCIFVCSFLICMQFSSSGFLLRVHVINTANNCESKEKSRNADYSTFRDLVEAGGVEPPSENASTGTSPGADSHLHSLTQAWADTLRGLVAS